MTKEVSPASWVGQAAHEIIQLTARTGASAHVMARDLVTELLDYGIDLASVDARSYVRQHLGMPSASAGQSVAPASRPQRRTVAVRKEREPTSTASWLGMAAHEIEVLTNVGASAAAKLARDIAGLITRQGHPLLDTDPRANARLHFGPEALEAKRQEHEGRQEARRSREARQSAFLHNATARIDIAA